MWSEELDNNLRNAADKDIPPYDEKTWDGMNQLLEKHLPQKKKRRGVIFFLFLGLLLLIPGIFMITKFSSHTDSVAQQQPTGNTNTTSTTGTQTNNVPVTPNDNAGNNNTIADKKSVENSSNTTTVESPAKINVQTASPSVSTPPASNNTVTPAIQQSTDNTTTASIASNVNTPSKKLGTQKNKPSATKGNTSLALATTSATAVTNPSTLTDNNNKDDKSTPATTTSVAAITPDKKQTTTTSQPVSNTPASTVGNAIISNATATTTAAIDKSVVKTPAVDSVITSTTDPVAKNKKQLPAKKGNKLSFTLSIGPDVTSVGVDRLGKVKGQVGVGVGYAITNKLGVRAGFFAGRKIYSADSTSYHTNITGPYRLYNIDANCFVYEIPVSFTYSLGVTEKHNWFVSGGLSSYIMKEEKYLYTYKSSPSSLSPYYYEHDLRNENKHFFSVLNLSGGYQYNVSKHLSLMAEPYLKLPMTGIGAGKVRLNSTGILFTVAVRPFAR